MKTALLITSGILIYLIGFFCGMVAMAASEERKNGRERKA